MEKNNLCKEIERTAGYALLTPRDFDNLSDDVYQRTHERVSASTLKRLWGYVGNDIRPRKATLDILSRYAGYADFEGFLSRSNDVESNLILSHRISSSDLFAGQQIRLRWQPDRICTVEYNGQGNFRVVEAVNTKLTVGDTFQCHLIIDGEPLYVDHLIHEGSSPLAYVAGRESGVIFELL